MSFLFIDIDIVARIGIRAFNCSVVLSNPMLRVVLQRFTIK